MKRKLTIQTRYWRNREVIDIWVNINGSDKILIQLQPKSIFLNATSKTTMKELTEYTTSTWKNIQLEY